MMEVCPETLAIVQLIRSENVGPITFWQLIDQCGSAHQALAQLPDLAKRASREITICKRDQAVQEIIHHQQQDIQLLTYKDPQFPSQLKSLVDCPPVISVKGMVANLSQPGLGIVGSRNASLAARHFTEKLAQDLSMLGWGVVSGLARGIDRYAHLGSLAQGTMAVLAGGVDVLYPPENRDIYETIGKAGCLISEMPLGLHPGATHFPRRNRLISGLSQGVIVIEAARRSGSLITARFALDQGRELFAVPGSPLDPRCQGSNDLLRQGAHLVTSVEDVVSVLGNRERQILQQPTFSNAKVDSIQVNNEKLTDELLTDLSATPIHIDLLVQRYDCAVITVMASLLELELSGLIYRDAAGYVMRRYEVNQN